MLNIQVMRKLRSIIEALKEILIHSADPRLLKVTKGYCIEVLKELRSKIEATKGNSQSTYILSILELKSEIKGYCIEIMKELRSKIEASKGNTQGSCIKVISKLRSEIEALKEMLIHSADPRLLKVTKGYC